MRDVPGVDNSMAAEEEENSKTFLFPVEEIQTVFNGNRTRLNIFIFTIITLLLLFDLILLARSLR